MPLVTIFNLSADDPLPGIAEAVSRVLASTPELQLNEREIDLVPVLAPDSFEAATTRINVDLWEQQARTKEALQELATRVAAAFQSATAKSRKVKVVIRPYEVKCSGCVSL
jgi:cytochrome c556